MAFYEAPVGEMKFLLAHVFNCDQVWSSMPATAEVNLDLAGAILTEGAKFVEQELLPINASGDQQGCRLEEGAVYTPDGFKAAYHAFSAAGWQGLGGDERFGGQGLPKMLTVCFEEMLWASNASFTLYPILTNGAALLLSTHGSDELKKTYLEKMYAGQWTGTMCLTESHAGTDLGMIRTKAEPTGDHKYLISGTKIFISGGEQDLTENIVHFVLARLPGAPQGVKGISLFLVPKIKLDSAGNLSESNNATCASIEHKMGIKGAATCVMNFDAAEGYLVGEENAGLAAMFTMMNYERLSIGIQGLGAGELAYQNALAYAKDRLQGRASKKESGQPSEADPIIDYPDVRRMLLEIKSSTEAGRALAMYIGLRLDISKNHQQKSVRDEAQRVVGLLTPIAKAYLTDQGLENCLHGQMVFGGHGYINEWGMEQAVRDVRISQIYEGTNGVQAMDLMGRKVVLDQGQSFKLLIAEMEQCLAGAESNALTKEYCSLWSESLSDLVSLTEWIIDEAQQNRQVVGASASHYLKLMGLNLYAFMWIKMLMAAENKIHSEEFRESKKLTANYFFAKVLPQRLALDAMIRSGSDPMMAMDEALF